MIVAGSVKDGKVITNGGTVACSGELFGISGSGSGATTYGNGTLIANGTVSLGDQSGLVAGDAAVKFNVTRARMSRNPDGTKADAKPAVALHYFQPTKLAQGLHGKAEAGWDESGKKLSAGTLVLADTSGEADKNKPAEGKPPVTPPANSQSATPTTPVNTQQEIAAQQQRKIIRNGEMEFEVESFDSAFVTVTKIVTEQGGYVQSSSSDKLANGKVRGTVVVRVPPDQLDVLVLKLRALGDLKSQKITAQDVTKVYYDMESELKAARAMEERLLNIIKTGKGEIKDLIEAEKQLGVYREKIEKLEGEIRYYNNMVSLSTLSISLTEKDIRAAAFAAQTENGQHGHGGGGCREGARRCAQVHRGGQGPGDRVEPQEIRCRPARGDDRVRSVTRRRRPADRPPQADRPGVAPGHRPQADDARCRPCPPARSAVRSKDTRFSISLYNLANVAPRQTKT